MPVLHAYIYQLKKKEDKILELFSGDLWGHALQKKAFGHLYIKS